ncbi:hypothetical protein QOT17_000121 [Balamuthia mandrillaris]
MRRDQPSARPQREGFATISRYSPSLYMHQGRYSLSQERVEAFRVAATPAEVASMQGRCYSGPSVDASPCRATCCVFAGCSTSNYGHPFGTQQPLLERHEHATEPSSRVQQTHPFEEERAKRAMFSTLYYFVGGSTSKETKRKRSSSSNDNQDPHYGSTASTTQRGRKWPYSEDAQPQPLQQDNDNESRKIRRRAFPGHYGDEELPPPALPLSSDPTGVPQWEGRLSIGAGLRYRNVRNSSEHTGLWR